VECEVGFLVALATGVDLWVALAFGVALGAAE
jgi:hypothetical protein